MQKLEQSLSEQLKKCYTIKQLREYIVNQITQLTYLPVSLKCTSNFTLIKFKVPSINPLYSFATDHDKIQFMMVIGKNYPLSPPRLHLINNLLRPGINDTRDLVPNLLMKNQQQGYIQKWNYKLTLNNIQQRIPKFLSTIKKQSDIFYIARIGHFQLNLVYPMEVIRQLRGDNVFFGFKSNNVTQGTSLVLMDISATHLAIFVTKQQPYFNHGRLQIPQQKSITQCFLIFYAQLGTLQEIYIDRTNFTDLQLIFTSQKPHNLSLQSCTKTIKLRVKKGLNFLRKLIKNRKYYDVSQIDVSFCPQTMQQQQKHILSQIQKAKKAIQHHLNLQTIKLLVDEYQAAIQYYSTRSLPYYEIYLDYITRLYQRQDIKTIMGTNLPKLIKKSSSNSS